MGLLLVCKNCGYFWESRKRLGMPLQCPRCKSQDITRQNLIKYYKNPYS